MSCRVGAPRPVPELTGDVLRIFVRRVFASMKRRARAQWGIKEPQCGAVTFVQRFGGALNLNVHFHTLVLDGVFDPAKEMRFRRQRLERLCRYVARPPVATERLTRLSNGRLMYELRHPWRDGTTHVAFLPLELIEKLAALVPPPRVNLVRYHGVLAPAARHRADVVPGGPKCLGRMRVLTAIHSPEAIQAILKCLGLPGRSPPIAPPDPRDSYNDTYFDVC